MLYTMEQCDFILSQINDNDNRLNDWEAGFVRSIRRQRYAGQNLSNKQVQNLSNIWDKLGGK